jgi:hypothetical protein
VRALFPWIARRGAALVLALALPQAAAGEDGFRLRAELWDFFQWNEDDSRQNKIVFRSYQDVALGGDWSVTFREDIPLLLTDKVGTENPTGEWASGLGDAFAQAVLTTPEVLPRTRLQAGVRVIFPTGQRSPFSGSTYQVGPQVAVTHRIEGIAQGILLQPTARYLVSVAKATETAATVRKVQLFPKLSVRFDDRWGLAFWDDEPIVWDRETGAWFVPFDGMVTYDFAPGATLKFGGSVPMTGNTTTYKHVVYGSLSFRF